MLCDLPPEHEQVRRPQQGQGLRRVGRSDALEQEQEREVVLLLPRLELFLPAACFERGSGA